MFLGSGSAQPKLCIFAKNDNRMKKSSEFELFNGGKKGGGKGGDFVLGCPQVDTSDQNAGKTLNF